MEPTGIEPVSKLGINLPLIHRFSLSDPQGGNHPLSRMTGCTGFILASKSTSEGLLEHPLGLVSAVFNGVGLQTLDASLEEIRQ